MNMREDSLSETVAAYATGKKLKFIKSDGDDLIDFIEIGDYKYKFQFPGVQEAFDILIYGTPKECRELFFSNLFPESANSPKLTDKYFSKDINSMEEIGLWDAISRALLWRVHPEKLNKDLSASPE